jgi:glycosyltransferase involved in cell wall biosynthesis
MNPLVSIVIPTRNSAQTLEACLNSIRNQTYNHIELIVVDNFSTDQTLSVASRFTPHIFQQGPERSAQRNFGVRQATGKYVLLIDSDMELEQSVVGACVDTVGRSHCKAIIVPEESFGEGFWAQCKKLERSFYRGVDWIEAARFFDTALYRQLGGYNEAMVSGEDWELSSRAGQLTSIGRIEPSIYHNEGRLRLASTLKKKLYYADQFTKYTASARESRTAAHGAQPASIVLKRFGLFLSRPSQLLRRPHLGFGMLFMKTCEFGFGALGYLFAKVTRSNNERA